MQDENIIEQTMQLIKKESDEKINLIVCPEGLLNLYPSSFPINSHFSKMKRMLISQSPDATIILGSKLLYSKKQMENNIVIQCDSSGFVKYRNKKTLVPFGEYIPYEKFLGKIPMVRAVVSRPITYNPYNDHAFEYKDFKVLPLICYELYFGNEIRQYFKKNKSIGVICCVANEYAIPNKIYYTQFLRMSKIQAISFKTPVIKSTVNGRSSIITPKGNSTLSNYNTTEILKGRVFINPRETVYAKHGYLFVFIFLTIFSPLMKFKQQ